ncbi:MAG: cytochrome c oxidase subunit II [Proteobacteria bacterium]|nr:cytochrome c oxidase subunit II [Pseudomonadota bacterium]
MIRRFWRRMAWIVPLACSACGETFQSALQPAGPHAASLARLIWSFTAICGVIWLLVMLVLLFALWRRHRPAEARHERRATAIIGAAVAATVLIITGLTLMSYAATRGLSDDAPDPVVIRVRGYQWWWEVTYADRRPERTFVTANEIHIPLHRPVRLELTAADVIHSFWVPNLAGKQDLIPGRNNTLTIVADAPGTYRAQCAEFCGLQHAHMALPVIAEDAAAFDTWRQAQLAEAPAPVTAEQAAGRDFFTAGPCSACHTVRGTSAAGRLGPDLTHVASRQTIAAGQLPTTRGSLAAWIADPQTIKPGNNMPLVPMTPDQLQSVSAWLASLR